MCGFIEALIELEKEDLKLKNMADKKFEWTDELVLKFARFTNCESPDFQGRHADLEQFKQEQQSKRDWQVLTMVDGNNWVHPYNRTDIPCCDKCKIHSVKRLSDGQVFSVGDDVEWNKGINKYRILAFEISSNNGNMLAITSIGGVGVNNIHKQRLKPLFRSNDDKDIYDGEDFWLLYTAPNGIGDAHKTKARKELLPFQSYQKTFSTQEAAEDYILTHKPILSLEDLLSVWHIGSKYVKADGDYRESRLFNNFKQLASDKLNKK